MTLVRQRHCSTETHQINDEARCHSSHHHGTIAYDTIVIESQERYSQMRLLSRKWLMPSVLLTYQEPATPHHTPPLLPYPNQPHNHKTSKSHTLPTRDTSLDQYPKSDFLADRTVLQASAVGRCHLLRCPQGMEELRHFGRLMKSTIQCYPVSETGSVHRTPEISAGYCARPKGLGGLFYAEFVGTRS